jgi:tetratricopeptide repeat protein
MRKISFAVLLLLISAAPAWAAPKTAGEWYDEGANQYTLGNFEKAIDAFKQGFSLEPDESKKANYLYNIAQAYRQVNDCKNALFFYKRFLALKANDTAKPLPAKTRKAVEDFIADAENCVRQQTQLSQKPPVTNVPPDGEGSEKHASADRGRPPGDTARQEPPRKEVAAAQKPAESDSDPEDTGVTQPVTGGQPRIISARLIGGGSKVSAGSVSVPLQPTVGLVGGYPIPINPRLTVEAGVAFTFTPTPYQAGTMTKTGSLVGMMANGGATYEVMPKLGIRGDLGLGALLFGGIDQSQFTNNAPTTGALTMFHLRAAVSADYAITPNVVLTAMPGAFTYSPAAAGIAGGGAIWSYDFMLGIGFRR